MSQSPRPPAEADSVWPTPGSWVRELVQTHADDVVLAAALCKPNAPGSHELVSFGALGQRQLLKARGAYLAERVALGVTALHVHALALFAGNRWARALRRWSRADVYAAAVTALGDKVEPAWPAVLLTDARGKSLVELQVLERSDDAWELLALLMRRPLPPVR